LTNVERPRSLEMKLKKRIKRVNKKKKEEIERNDDDYDDDDKYLNGLRKKQLK